MELRATAGGGGGRWRGRCRRALGSGGRARRSNLAGDCWSRETRNLAQMHLIGILVVSSLVQVVVGCGTPYASCQTEQ